MKEPNLELMLARIKVLDAEEEQLKLQLCEALKLPMDTRIVVINPLNKKCISSEMKKAFKLLKIKVIEDDMAPIKENTFYAIPESTFDIKPLKFEE